MKEAHIINLLEERPAPEWDERERAMIEIHIADCADCRRAYRAAMAAADLLGARANETIEPSPFFNARVMAALREKQSPAASTLAAMWKAARALIVSMAAAVALLVGLTLWISGSQSQPLETAESENIYSAEWVILENGDPDDLTYGEIMTTLYEVVAYGEDK